MKSLLILSFLLSAHVGRFSVSRMAGFVYKIFTRNKFFIKKILIQKLLSFKNTKGTRDKGTLYYTLNIKEYSCHYPVTN